MDTEFAFHQDQYAQFIADYTRHLAASGAQERFEADPSFGHAAALTLAIYDAVHETAPEGAKIALMYSGGKDSSAALHYYVESVLARVEAGKRFVGGSAILSSTQHEFPAMHLRQVAEIEALNKWGAKYDFSAEMVTPPAKATVLVELLGSGLALPPRARNDAAVRAGIGDWCISRAKSDILDLAVDRAAAIAPFVIQVLGSRYDESSARGATMNKYSIGLPYGLTRMKTRDADEVDSRFIGLHAVGHLTGKHVRDFVHEAIPSYRPFGNLELEQIYRDMSGPGGAEATECSIQRTADGSFAGGCSNLATGTRSGCRICLKSVNNALKNLVTLDPKRYGLTYRVQERINRHQDLVHARPKTVKAVGLTPDQVFPKGFTFLERYKMLVMVMAAEIESGERQLTDEQLSWIERRWQRHGVFTVTTQDARNDAYAWLNSGCEGDPVPFFSGFGELAGDFTFCMGEGMSLGAFAANCDDDQDDLNLSHLLGLGITGAPIYPKLLSYVFADRSDPDRLIVAVTDEPAVMGTRTNTGLINGMSGAMLTCVGVRQPSYFEEQMSDGRHLFYEVRRSQAPRYMKQIEVEGSKLPAGGPRWTLADFLGKEGPPENVMSSFLVGHAATWLDSLGEANGAHCGVDFDPLTEQYHRHEAIFDLRGKLTSADLKRVFNAVADQVELSEYLQDATTQIHQSLISDLRATVKGDWALLSGDNDAGKALRRDIRFRLKESLFGTEANLQGYRDYLANLKILTTMYRDGILNTSLAVKVAFIIRTSWYCPKDAEADTVELLKLLGVQKAEPSPQSGPVPQPAAVAA